MRSTRLAAQTACNFVTIAANALSGLVLTALIARWLGPDRMGSYSLLTWFLTMAGIAVNLGLVTTTMKHMAEALGREDAAEAGGILADGVKRIVRNGLLVTAGWLAATPFLVKAYHQPELAGMLPVASLAIVPVSLMAILTAACQGLQRYGTVALATVLYALTLMAGSATALHVGVGVGGLLAISGGAALVSCAVALFAIGRWQPGWWRLGLDEARREALSVYGRSLMLLVLLDAIVWQRSGVFFLGWSHPGQQVAFFAMAFALATMAMRLIPGTLVGLLIPTMARSFGSGQMDQVARAYRAAGRWMAILAVPTALGGAALAGPVVAVLYGPTYAPMAPILVMLLISAGLVNIFGFPGSSVLYAVDGQKVMVWNGVVAATVNLSLMALLTPSFGVWGAAIATVASQLIGLPLGAIAVANRLNGALPDVSRLPRVTAAAALAVAPALWAALNLSPHLAMLVGIPVAVALYPPLLWYGGALADDDREQVMAALGRFRPAREQSCDSAHGTGLAAGLE